MARKIFCDKCGREIPAAGTATATITNLESKTIHLSLDDLCSSCLTETQHNLERLLGLPK